MKLPISFKCPDAIHSAMVDVPEDMKEVVKQNLEKWVFWGEYITVIYDTETDLIIVEEK